MQGWTIALIIVGALVVIAAIWWFMSGSGNNASNVSLLLGSGDLAGQWIISWKPPANKGNGTGLHYLWSVSDGSTVVQNGDVPDVEGQSSFTASFPEKDTNGDPVLAPSTTYVVSVTAASSTGSSPPSDLNYVTPDPVSLVGFNGGPIDDGTTVTKVTILAQCTPATAAFLSNWLAVDGNNANAAAGQWALYQGTSISPSSQGSFPCTCQMFQNYLSIASTSTPWPTPNVGDTLAFTLAFDWPFCGPSNCPVTAQMKWTRGTPPTGVTGLGIYGQ